MENQAVVEERSPTLRPIHYMGNKSRFLTHIEAAVNEVCEPGAAALDLFAGSGVVARRLAENRPVIASDIQAYSSVLAAALTKPAQFTALELQELFNNVNAMIRSMPGSVQQLIEYEEDAVASQKAESLAELLEAGSLIAGNPSDARLRELHDRAQRGTSQEPSLTLFRHYGGVYFSYKQALELDAIAQAVRNLPDDRRTTGLAALLGTASDVVPTVGSHFAQPLRPRDGSGRLKSGWVPRLIRARRQSVSRLFETWISRYVALKPTPHECRPLRGDFRDVLNSMSDQVGVVYVDPPYTRDHYSRFYHVLETLALGDDPGVSRSTSGSQNVASRGLYRVDRHQSPFSIRSQVGPAFTELFSQCKRLGVPLVLSYSPTGKGTVARPQPRLLTVPQLSDMAGDYFRTVSVQATDRIAHSKFNRQALNGEVDYDAEILILATP